MQVSHSEGPANHTGPESCVGICEDAGEALTGERIGQPLSRESLKVPGVDVFGFAEDNMDGCVPTQVLIGIPARVRGRFIGIDSGVELLPKLLPIRF